MILKKFKLKTDIKNTPEKINQSNIQILKKTLSDLSIKIKKKESNSSLSTSNYLWRNESTNLLNSLNNQNSFLKSNTISAKNIFTKRLNKKLLNDKTAKEMGNKFYIRYREGVTDLDKKFNLFNTIIKSHPKILKKIFLDYKNIQNYDKEVLSSNINNYNRNLELLENHEKVKEHQALQNSHQFEKFRNSNNPNNIKSLLPQIKSPSESKHSSIFLNLKSHSPSIKKVSNYNKLEKKVHNILIQKKHLTNKKLKENSKKFCDEILDLDKECELYEPIDEYTSKINLKKNNFFNLGNLDRIIKLECLKDDKFYNEDYEKNRAFFKKCNEANNYLCDKALAGYCPNYVKKGNFLSTTLNKYNNLQGNFV